MPYQCDLGPGQKIYLDNPGTLTVITLAHGGPGQQQQSSSQIQTGPWIEVPQVAKVGSGVLVHCVTAQGSFSWQVQGIHIEVVPAAAWAAAQGTPMQPTETRPTPMAPMQPMAPMTPMNMGPMEMSANPMTMRMGNMTLESGAAIASPQQSSAQKFCTQCGAAVAEGDRYCGSCGHPLK